MTRGTRPTLSLAAAVLLLAQCGTWRPVSIDAGESVVVVAATSSREHAQGAVSVAARRSGEFRSAHDLLTIHYESAVVTSGSRVYVVEGHGADSLVLVDGPALGPENLAYRQSLGTPADARDIAVAGRDKAYVSRRARSSLAVVECATGAVVDEISLAGAPYVHGPDTVPFMGDVLISEGSLYVALQRLVTEQGRFGGYPGVKDSSGMIAVVSISTDKVTRTIRLRKKRPVTMDTCGGFLYVACGGSPFDATDGGIEKISLSTGENTGVVITEKQLGGDVSLIITTGAKTAYVAVEKTSSTFQRYSDLIQCDLDAGSVGASVPGFSGSLGGLAFDGEYLYVGDRSENAPGIVVIEPRSNTKVAGPISVGRFPPVSIAVMRTE
ncbi:MAG: hypothetical protein GF418_04200 [Chitinivibrionales bacterium]|nr:hypothetical protein [Chitinivibrionales bacterium]MBD3394809.1 hypothetical protein [Chitinivibrionales bacterium]